MKFGMNLLLWSGELSDEMLPTLELLKNMGYDGVELPVFNLDMNSTNPGTNAWTIWDWGGRRSPCAVSKTTRPAPIRRFEPRESPSNKRRSIAVRPLAARTWSVHCTRRWDTSPARAPRRTSGSGASTRCANVAEYAAQCGVTLGMEVLNRFECYLLNTHADLARFVKDVDHPNCRAMYDTFHSHIEEKSTADAIRSCADVLAHVHISENDRSTPGSGNVRWQETFDTLKEVGYDGWLTIEAFGLALPELVAATKIWRRMYISEQQLAEEGLAFMKSQVSKRW